MRPTRDDEMGAMARDEIARLEADEARLIEDLKVLLLPRDPNDDRDVILEIRAGAGGEEAALFAAELLRLYLRYAAGHRYATEVMSLNETGIDGIKEAIVQVRGDGAYSRLKFEGGVHRVQRIPATESSGRIHTSTATVVVMPEADEVEIEIDEERDIRIDIKRSSGPGGQSVNTTDSAVRITHLPSGPRGRDPGREEPAQEQGQGDVRPALAPPRPRDPEAARRRFGGSAIHGRERRPERQGPHLQLPAGPRHGPSDRQDRAQPAGRHERRDRRSHRCARDGRPGRSTGDRDRGRRHGRVAMTGSTPPPGQVDPLTADDVRFLPPRDRPIARATDLGSVQVLKHGNVYLLTDAFGDIHPDSRGLGLYHGDTRLLSCLVLRVGGERPVLLQGSVGANYRGGIVMTNPSADRNPDAKVHPLDDLTGRTVGITRDRLIGADGLREQLRVVNHGERPVSVAVELELGADSADIFEVRGYPRTARGRQLPVAVTDRRVTFRYDGLDDIQRLTHLALDEPADTSTSASDEIERRDPPALDGRRWRRAPRAICPGRSGRRSGRRPGQPTMPPPAGATWRPSSHHRPTSPPTRAWPPITRGSAARPRSTAITSCSTWS